MKTLYAAVLAATLVLPAAGATAAPGGGDVLAVLPSFTIPLPGKARDTGRPVQLAQSYDPRVSQMEEQIRQLNGRIEEMNFMILQMQEQLRKQQEDLEFRMQQIEEKKSDAGAPSDGNQVAVAGEQPMDANGDAAPGGTDTPVAGNEPAKLGEPPRTLGTISVDMNGNVVSSGSQPVDIVPTGPAAMDGTTVAALPQTDNPDELYGNSYQFVLSGDYTTAETGFRSFIERFPENEKIPDAQYWLGETLLGQDRFQEAAQVYLDASKAHPDARKAPDMLLKLGISLAAMGKTDIACATYAAVGQKYPKASGAIKERIKQEQALAGC